MTGNFQEGNKGLKEAYNLSGKQADYTNFAKLMGKYFKDVRGMGTLLIPTIWDTSNVGATLQRFPTE